MILGRDPLPSAPKGNEKYEALPPRDAYGRVGSAQIKIKGTETGRLTADEKAAQKPKSKPKARAKAKQKEADPAPAQSLYDDF